MTSLLPIAGIAPKTAPRLLPEQFALVSDNVKPYAGELRAWFDTAPIQTAMNGINAKTIALLTGLNAHEFLDWDSVIEFVRGPVAGDLTNRFMFTGEKIEPRVSNLALATNGSKRPASWFVLGVSKPDQKPLAVVAGGSGNVESRVYVECFVTPWGEPSATGPASDVVSGFMNGTWNLSNLSPPPPNTGNVTAAIHSSGIVTVTASTVRGLRAGEYVTHAGVNGMTDLNGSFKLLTVDSVTNKYTINMLTNKVYTSGGTWTRDAPHNTTGMVRRIYRSSTGTSATSLYFVAEIPATLTTYADTIPSSSLGEVLPSMDWDMPPSDLRGLIEMPNGIVIGYSKNEFCACEPWRPYAWPIKYRMSTPKDIMGLGSYETTAVITTKGLPYTATGSHPEQFSMNKVELTEPCLSSRGVVSMAFGVVYPSPNGLALVSASGARLVSEQIFSREAWQELNPASIHAVAFCNHYWFWYDTGNNQLGMIFDALGGAQSAYPLSLYTPAACVDEATDLLYLLRDGKICLWDGDPLNAIPFVCKSKTFVIPSHALPGAARVTADYSEIANRAKEYVANQAAIAAAKDANAAIWAGGNFGGEFNATMPNVYPVDGSKLTGANLLTILARKFVRFTLYVNGKLKYTREVLNDQIFTLPRDYRGAQDIEFEVSGNVDVHLIEHAPTPRALRKG